ncbi:MAG: rRNA maturation RNase YbeY, partial [Bacteroidota bacterium]
MPESIRFIRNDVRFRMPGAVKLPTWLRAIAKKEGAGIESLSYVFCTDDFLLDLNRCHLDHDYYTDIITFDLSADIPQRSTWNKARVTKSKVSRSKSAPKKPIEGEIYISVDRVRENAETFDVSFQHELYRVMAHGLLHLLGYKDKTKADKMEMRNMEDKCLKIFL